MTDAIFSQEQLERIEARFLGWYSWRAMQTTLEGFVFAIHRPDPPWEAWAAEKIRAGHLQAYDGNRLQVTAAGADLWAPYVLVEKLKRSKAENS